MPPVIPDIAKWLACVYRSMDELQANEDIRSQLNELNLLPLADGHIVSLHNCSVFFPLEKEERQKKLQKGKGNWNIQTSKLGIMFFYCTQ